MLNYKKLGSKAPWITKISAGLLTRPGQGQGHMVQGMNVLIKTRVGKRMKKTESKLNPKGSINRFGMKQGRCFLFQDGIFSRFLSGISLFTLAGIQ